MNSEEIIQMLLIRAQEVEKRKNRIALFFYIIPLIYFLFQFSVLEELSFYSITIKQIGLIHLATPVIYSLLIFYFVYLNEDFKALRKHIKIPKDNEKNMPYFFSKNYLIFPPDLPLEIVRNMKFRNLFSEFGTIFIFFPLSMVVLIGPLIFLIWCIYIAGWAQSITTYHVNYIFVGISIWLFLGACLYSRNRNKELEKANF